MILGRHIVNNIREFANGGAAGFSTSVELKPLTPSSPQMHVNFSATGDYTVALFPSMPRPLVQYTCPNSARLEFLALYPLGQEVMSNLRTNSDGSHSLEIRRVNGPVAPVFLTGLDVATAPPLSDVPSAENQSLPAEFKGRWQTGGRTYEFDENSRYFVYDTQGFSISDDGQNLTWGSSTFVRISSEASGIAGWWQNTSIAEDILFRANGSYTFHDGSGIDAIGEYSVSGSSLTTAELRAVVSATGNQITFDAVYSGQYTATFSFSSENNTLTLDFDGTELVYTRLS